jgi:DNA-binding NarL/FixJ family response regulator
MGDDISATISVAVVDDHVMVAEMLSFVISSQPDLRLVGTAGGVAEALALVEAERPRVVLMDFRLPDGDGIAAVKLLLERWPDTAVIMLSGTDEHDLLAHAAEAGCVGFLAKDRPIEDVIAAVRAAARGELVFKAGEIALLLSRLRHTPSVDSQLLTSRELEILRLLAKGHSTDAIADELFISVNTVRNHVSKILSKLGAHSKLEAVAIAVRDKLVTL